MIDEFAFPSSVRQRFALAHPQLDADGRALAESATRQWFRLAARHPRARLSMPSAVVDDLWHELVLHTREYAAFCDAAFGRFLHHVPESAMDPAGMVANRSAVLLATLRLAQQDEGAGADRLPLLFTVDARLAVPGARRYLLDCGGQHECFPVSGTTCLRHLCGVPRLRRRWADPTRAMPTNRPGMSVDGGGCGGGCGGN